MPTTTTLLAFTAAAVALILLPGPNVIFLRTGLPTFRPAHRAGSAGDGLLLVFVVDDVDAVYDTVRAAGAPAVRPPETEPWGERYCQFEDPNGIIVQFVTWV